VAPGSNISIPVRVAGSYGGLAGKCHLPLKTGQYLIIPPRTHLCQRDPGVFSSRRTAAR